MIIYGSGITTFSPEILPGFRPQTTLALSWFQTESGAWRATDRGTAADTYESDVMLKGKEADIDNFIYQIFRNRSAGSNIIAMSGFSTGEYIFGANVDHTGIIAGTVIAIGKKTQTSWRGFGVSARLRASLPAFVGATSPLPLTNLEIGFVGDAEQDLKKLDSYSGAFAYLDGGADFGRFEGVFNLTAADMAQARNYIAAIRGTSFSVATIGGVAQMFGKRRGAYPFDVNIIEWEDMGQYDAAANRWRLRLVLTEAFA
jgi:hypothetical protein